MRDATTSLFESDESVIRHEAVVFGACAGYITLYRQEASARHRGSLCPSYQLPERLADRSHTQVHCPSDRCA